MMVLLPTRPPGPHASDRKTTASQSTDGAPLGPIASDVVAEAKAGDQRRRKKVLQAILGMVRQARQHVAQVHERVVPVTLAARHHAEQDRPSSCRRSHSP